MTTLQLEHHNKKQWLCYLILWYGRKKIYWSVANWERHMVNLASRPWLTMCFSLSCPLTTPLYAKRLSALWRWRRYSWLRIGLVRSISIDVYGSPTAFCCCSTSSTVLQSPAVQSPYHWLNWLGRPLSWWLFFLQHKAILSSRVESFRFLRFRLVIQPSLTGRIKCCTPSVRPSGASDFLEVGKPQKLLF